MIPKNYPKKPLSSWDLLTISPLAVLPYCFVWVMCVKSWVLFKTGDWNLARYFTDSELIAINYMPDNQFVFFVDPLIVLLPLSIFISLAAVLILIDLNKFSWGKAVCIFSCALVSLVIVYSAGIYLALPVAYARTL